MFSQEFGGLVGGTRAEYTGEFGAHGGEDGGVFEEEEVAPLEGDGGGVVAGEYCVVCKAISLRTLLYSGDILD